MGNNHSNNHHLTCGVTMHRKSSKSKPAYTSSIITLSQLLIEKSVNDHVNGNISRRIFVKYFSNRVENAAERLYEHFVSKQDTMDVHYITGKTFLRVSEEILNLSTISDHLKYCFKIFSKSKDHLTQQGVESIIRASYLMAANISTTGHEIESFTNPDAKFIVNSMLTAIFKDNASITIDNFIIWVRKNCINMIFGIHQWITNRLLNVDATFLEITHNNDDLKSLQTNSACVQSNVLNPFLLWLLTCSLPIEFTKPNRTKPSLYKMLNGHLDPHTFIQKLLLCSNPVKWTSLYQSSSQGLSINRFQNHVFAYRGSTVVLITAEDDRKFCVAVDQEWKESAQRWGGENCTIIQITPKYQTMEVGPKMMYLNLNNRGYPTGLHIGQNPKQPILEMDKEMAYIFVQKIPYQLISIEVWGCAGEDMLEAQIQQKRWEAQEAERHRKVNLNAVEWKHNPDKYLLELGGCSSRFNYPRDS